MSRIFGTTSGGVERAIAVDTDGKFLVGGASSGILTLAYDYVKVTYPSATTEVYTTRLGGSGGDIQEIVTVTYTDSTKEDLDSVERA